MIFALVQTASECTVAHGLSLAGAMPAQLTRPMKLPIDNALSCHHRLAVGLWLTSHFHERAADACGHRSLLVGRMRRSRPKSPWAASMRAVPSPRPGCAGDDENLCL
jgi:hypothetical protein